MKKFALIFIIFDLILFSGLFLIRHRLATQGDEIAQILSQSVRLSQVNSQLNSQLLEYSSLPYLESQARKLGFVPASVSQLLPLPLAAAPARTP